MSGRVVPPSRISAANTREVRRDGDYVLYWMIASRRLNYNYALQRAVEYAVTLHKPLIILEALRSNYRWASDRLHAFVLQGMQHHAARLAELNHPGIHYYPWLERAHGEGSGLLMTLGAHACVVVTDDFPSFFVPRMVTAAAEQLPVRLEYIDSNGLLPMRSTDRIFDTAHAFRRHLHRELPTHLEDPPLRHPLSRRQLPALLPLPERLPARWPPLTRSELDDIPNLLRSLPIDHTVAPVRVNGGSDAARRRLKRFLEGDLHRYIDEGNHPDRDCRSGLSPWLHFGHLSVHECFERLAAYEQWTPLMRARKPTGRREGWWGMTAPAEAWLDELVTWREVGYNMAALHPAFEEYRSLPEWARQTLDRHARDQREFTYTLGEFSAANTHDELWNAAQRQLVREGRIHSYLRMLWGKKILEWTPDPGSALAIMLELNNRYALDGRDPNSCSGIFWILGRYDRPWFPERPVFGTIRYMSSDNTRRKLRVREYLARYADQPLLI